MGFFSLSGQRIRVTAQAIGTNTSWILDAEPHAFTGKKPIIGQAGPDGHVGVTILIASSTQENVAPAANHAAKYFPFPVIVDGAEAKREDFLGEAKHIETWKGMRIGVYHNDVTYSSRHHTANFHGVILPVALPSLSQSHHLSYSARIDVLTRFDPLILSANSLPAPADVSASIWVLRLWSSVLTRAYPMIMPHCDKNLND